MAIRTRSFQNCWGRDQGNHKTVDGQGLHESQGQQPVGAAHQERSTQYDIFLHEPCNSVQRSGWKYATLLASKRQDTAEVVCDLSTSDRPLQSTEFVVAARRDQVGHGRETHEHKHTPIPHTYLSASIASMEPIEKGQPSCPEAGLEPPADGKCRQCSGRWQCPETEQESGSDQPLGRANVSGHRKQDYTNAKKTWGVLQVFARRDHVVVWRTRCGLAHARADGREADREAGGRWRRVLGSTRRRPCEV